MKIFRADLNTARPIGVPLGTGEVKLSSVISSKGLYDAWIPLEGATRVCSSPRIATCPCISFSVVVLKLLTRLTVLDAAVKCG